MITLLAVLVVVAQLSILALLATILVERLGGPRLWSTIAGLVGPDALRIAALVAVVAMSGSLYLSEVRHFPPCTLCWYQRIAMYPQAFILVIAAIRGDRSIAPYVIALSLIGAAISTYHYQLERFPDQAQIACASTVPCTTVWFTEFGYITIPMMALTGFIFIALLTWIGARHGSQVSREA